MPDREKRLLAAVKSVLYEDEESERTGQKIRELIRNMAAIPDFKVGAATQEKIARVIEARLDVSMDSGAILREASFRPWLSAAKATIDPFYWERYREFLKAGEYPPAVLQTMDAVNDATLGLLGNPQLEGTWDRRGLVLGHVQSGKTANYIGLISKAADAGYKVIIVIAGLQNTLRKQTQERIDEGFLGVDTGHHRDSGNAIGVGIIDTRKRPNYVTTTSRDFNRNSKEASGIQLVGLPDPVILVIKKNKSILENLNNWMRQNARRQRILTLPALIIDDEADNASINVAKNNEISRINGQIRELLNMFSRSSYVGYTATPFANVLIDPRSLDEEKGADLFPRDFIYSLDPPTNYMGASTIFGEGGSGKVIQLIEDNDSWLPLKHDIAVALFGLPDSLKESIRAFILAKAIRILRDDGRKHCSMLINASRFNRIQELIKIEVLNYKDRLSRAIRYEHAKNPEEALKNSEIQDLHETWEKQGFNRLIGDWETLQQKLWEAVAPIEVVTVNMNSPGILDYRSHNENGLNVIAVGGISLSRGLTLEGLTVSYFLRNSMMYDTVMQMGRWFGYRPGYEDLCRIWLTPDSKDWYERITESIEELREDLREMESRGMTPRQFGMKVLMHEDSQLIVTARNKMGAGQNYQFSADYSRALVESSLLSADQKDIDTNRKALTDLIAVLEKNRPHEKHKTNYFWKDVPVNVVIEFLQNFRNADANYRGDPKKLIAYINDVCNDEISKSELQTWDVVLMSLKTQKHHERIHNLTINCADRTAGTGKDFDLKKVIPVGDKKRVGQPDDLLIGLTDEEIASEDKKYEGRSSKAGRYMFKGRKPLLILRLVRMQAKSDNGCGKEIPGPNPKGLTTYGIIFPATDRTSPARTYTVSHDWRKLFIDDGVDDVDDDSKTIEDF